MDHFFFIKIELMVHIYELVPRKDQIHKNGSKFMVHYYELVPRKDQIHKNGSEFMVHSYELVWEKISIP